jgi:hypothetical protein
LFLNLSHSLSLFIPVFGFEVIIKFVVSMFANWLNVGAHLISIIFFIVFTYYADQIYGMIDLMLALYLICIFLISLPFVHWSFMRFQFLGWEKGLQVSLVHAMVQLLNYWLYGEMSKLRRNNSGSLLDLLASGQLLIFAILFVSWRAMAILKAQAKFKVRCVVRKGSEFLVSHWVMWLV